MYIVSYVVSSIIAKITYSFSAFLFLIVPAHKNLDAFYSLFIFFIQLLGLSSVLSDNNQLYGSVLNLNVTSKINIYANIQNVLFLITFLSLYYDNDKCIIL